MWTSQNKAWNSHHVTRPSKFFKPYSSSLLSSWSEWAYSLTVANRWNAGTKWKLVQVSEGVVSALCFTAEKRLELERARHIAETKCEDHNYQQYMSVKARIAAVHGSNGLTIMMKVCTSSPSDTCHEVCVCVTELDRAWVSDAAGYWVTTDRQRSCEFS